MKKLKNLLLINWGTFENVMVPFEDITFLYGGTGAGKSTIVDALEMIVTADTKGSYFNKAANDQSDRNLKGYLYGDVGSGILRENHDFTTYVAMEIEDHARKQRVIAGCAFDCYSNRDREIKKQWFIMEDQSLSYDLFVNDQNYVYTITQLKTKYKNKIRFYHTNKDYLNQLGIKYGNLNLNKYIPTFHKSLSFDPKSSISQFITEYVCQMDDSKDMEAMEKLQDNIRSYAELKKEGELNQQKIEKLNAIHEYNDRYHKMNEECKTLEFVLQELELEKLKKEKKHNESLLKRYCTHSKNLNKENIRIDEHIESMSRAMQKKELEYRGLDVTQTKKSLVSSINNIDSQINFIQNEIRKAFTSVHQHGEALYDKISEACRLNVPLYDYLSEYQKMKHLTMEDVYSLSFLSIMDHTNQCSSIIQQSYAKNESELTDLKKESHDLNQKITNLKENIKPFPRNVVLVKQQLEARLKEKYHKDINILILSDLLEITNEEWRNAIEGYLGQQKLYLLIPKEVYKDALLIYRNICNEYKISGIGLIDEDKLMTSEISQKENSLATLIRTEHQVARKYIDFLLGNVRMCANVTELNRHPISITKDVILYKSFVTRKINPKRYEIPYIGKEAVKLNLERTISLLHEKDRRLYEKKKKLNLLKDIKGLYEEYQFSKNEMTSYTIAINRQEELKRLINEKKEKQDQLDQLDLSICEALEKEITDFRAKIQKESITKGKNEQGIENYNEKIRQLEEKIIPVLSERITKKEEIIKNQNWTDAIISEGKQFINQNLDPTIKIEDLYGQVSNSYDHKQKDTNELFQDLIAKREEYNTIYKMSFNSRDDSNQKFDQELDRLEKIQLQEYESKIEKAKEKANETFRYDFIGKMRNKLQTVKRQIKELNDALKNVSFGKDQYEFICIVKPEYKIYYDMYMDDLLLDGSGWNLGSEQFNQKYKNEMEILFDAITPSREDMSAQEEVNQTKVIAKWIDFSTYLSFDLKVKNENGETQLLSKTLSKKSGGETQTPLYIAMLASFAQICKTLSYQGYENDRFALIVLDEAFSKMDVERIGESINLLRKFGLQAVFSAPDRNIEYFADKVDSNIKVFKEENRSYIALFDGRGLADDEL